MSEPSPYNRRWRKARKVFLDLNPLCKFCAAQGKITAASVVDHITPHRGDPSLFWDKSNWQPLCSVHHQATKQAIEKGKDVRLIGLDGYPI